DSPNQTVNAHFYCDVLRKLSEDICCKRSKM
ncbi:hypothetical protein EAI_07231, partial [Harpegnathos saltator]